MFDSVANNRKRTVSQQKTFNLDDDLKANSKNKFDAHIDISKIKRNARQNLPNSVEFIVHSNELKEKVENFVREERMMLGRTL